jgi:hypothetical protein
MSKPNYQPEQTVEVKLGRAAFWRPAVVRAIRPTSGEIVVSFVDVPADIGAVGNPQGLLAATVRNTPGSIRPRSVVWTVTLATPNGPGALDVPTTLGPDAASRRAVMTAASVGWGDLDELHVLDVSECLDE